MHQLLTFVPPLAWTPLSWEPGFKGKERRGGGPGAQASCQGKFHPETANRVTAGCPNGNHRECVSVDRPHVLPRGPGEGSVHQGAPRTPLSTGLAWDASRDSDPDTRPALPLVETAGKCA